VTIGFYPDAWARLGHALVGGPMPETLINAMNSFEQADDLETSWATFCKSFAPTWKIARAASEGPDWTGSDRIADWSRFLLGRAALSGSGRGIRTMERRLRRWTGQSRRSLNFFSAIEDLHRFSIKSPDVPLAELAVEAGYVDQSHMGRAIKRVTGFSPAQLNRLIETNESFWCYRLLGERF
jgi:Helix-turn-helix domain